MWTETAARQLHTARSRSLSDADFVDTYATDERNTYAISPQRHLSLAIASVISKHSMLAHISRGCKLLKIVYVESL